MNTSKVVHIDYNNSKLKYMIKSILKLILFVNYYCLYDQALVYLSCKTWENSWLLLE